MIFAALHIWILVIVVVGGLVILVIYLLFKLFGQRAQLDSDFTIRPPNPLRAPAAVEYRCQVTLGKNPPQGLKDVEVTFTLMHGHATIDGGASKKVVTGTDGMARITLTPVSSGPEELGVHVTVGSKSEDEQPVRFEVQKP